MPHRFAVDFLQPLVPAAPTSSDHPSKRRRGSNGSSTSAALSPLTTLNLDRGTPWSPSGVSPASIRLPQSNVNSPWGSRAGSSANTPSLELVPGFEGMGGGILGGAGSLTMTPTGEGADGGGVSFAATSNGKNGKAQQPSQGSTTGTAKASHPYQQSRGSSSNQGPKPRHRDSSGSSTGSHPNTLSSAPTDGTLTPYQAGFLASFTPVTPSSSALPDRARRGSVSGIGAPVSHPDLSQLQQHHHLAASMPASPNRRSVGLPGQTSASYLGAAGWDPRQQPQQQPQQQQQQAPPRLSLQEQLERAGMIPPSQPWEQQSAQPDMSFDFDFMGQFGGGTGDVRGMDGLHTFDAGGAGAGKDQAGGFSQTWNGS